MDNAANSSAETNKNGRCTKGSVPQETPLRTFLKKSRFTGSFKGMRYVLVKHENELEPATEETQAKTETVIRAIIWPEPFNFEVTPDEKKHHRDFPFTTDGIWEAVDWLNAEHEAGHY